MATVGKAPASLVAALDAAELKGDFTVEYLPRGGADDVRAAVQAGALGCSLSGSGPSLFALCRVEAEARRVAEAMETAVAAEIGGGSQTYVSSIAPHGARVVSACVS